MWLNRRTKSSNCNGNCLRLSHLAYFQRNYVRSVPREKANAHKMMARMYENIAQMLKLVPVADDKSNRHQVSANLE